MVGTYLSTVGEEKGNGIEGRSREEGTIGFEVTADSAGRDSRYRRVKNRCEFVADFTGNLR